jgi:2-desacetyl-2-hydroxyethyl bacteriochlorophyllide A dehydrogenase
MKAMVLTAPSELVLEDVARPVADGRQVLVRVTHSGICGTDYKIYRGAIPVAYPRIMGHEMVGEVVDAGDAAFRAGDRVIVDPELFCGACFHCRIGQTHLCPKGSLLGRDANGGFAEYLSAPASQVFPLPDSIDGRTAPMIQVLTTCLHAQRQINIFPSEYVVVLGLGVTGQLHVQLAKARGAKVIGITRSADKRALAETLGADITIPGGDGAVEKVREVTEGRGADAVIETTGVISQLAAGINMVRSGGRVLMFGIITVKEGALPFYDLYFKEVSLINARVAKSEDYPGAIALVERGVVRLEPLISDVMPLGELNAAIGMLGADGGGQRMKIIMDHGVGAN